MLAPARPSPKRFRSKDFGDDGDTPEKKRRVEDTAEEGTIPTGAASSTDGDLRMDLPPVQPSIFRQSLNLLGIVSDGASTDLAPDKRTYYRAKTSINMALVELMQELFMEAMRDGEIQNTERELLQMSAVVLSQVSKKFGDKPVSMATEEVDHIEKRFPEIVEFLDGVSKNIKAHFLGLRDKDMRKFKQEDNSLVMSSMRNLLDHMIEVHSDWQISAEDLIGICKEEEEVADFGTWTSFLWLGGVIGWSGLFWWLLTSCWNFFLRYARLEVTTQIADLWRMADWVIYGLQSLFFLVVLIVLLSVFDRIFWLVQLLPDKFMMRTRVWEMYTHGSWRRLSLVYHASRFFLLCFTYSAIKSWFDVVVVVLQIRVVMCFFSQLPIVGSVTYPLCYVAEEIMGWRQNHQILGCLKIEHADDEQMPGLPGIANFVGQCAVELLSCIACFCTDIEWHLADILSIQGEGIFVNMNISLTWAFKVLLDFVISTGMCQVYLDIEKTAERVVQPNFVLRSLRLGREIREAGTNSREANVNAKAKNKAKAKAELSSALQTESHKGKGVSSKGKPKAEDTIGNYMIIRAATVSRGIELESRDVKELQIGETVNVLELKYFGDRIRARIEQPQGWISILNLGDGYRWAEKKQQAKAKGGADGISRKGSMASCG